MARACYDPDANVTMLMKLGQEQKGSEAEYMPEFLSTHPLTQVTDPMIALAVHIALACSCCSSHIISMP
jgi:hypothetical protein